MNVSILTEDKFQREIFKASKIILKSIKPESPILIGSDILIDDCIQKYIHMSDDSTSLHNRLIRPFLLDTILRSETLAAGSGEICLNIVLELLEKTARDIKSGLSLEDIEKKRNKKINKIKQKINESSRKLKKSDAHMLLNKKFDLPIQKKIINEIINKSNIKSPFFLKRSNKRDTVILFSDGFIFDISPDMCFLPAGGVWERSDVKVLVIDGFIESVSEIHHLLERAALQKDPIVMFVRHMADEVKSTISLNLKRGTINLIPVEVGFDENTLNILNDIAICCNADIVSAYKGDLISSAYKKDLPSLGKIKITSKKITIINDVDPDIIRTQIDFLSAKRDNATENLAQDIKELFDKRIRSLSSGTIEISIGTDLLRDDPMSMEKFDKFFREFKSLVSSGVVYSKDFSNFFPQDLLIKDYPYSSIAMYSSLKYAHSVIRDLFSIKRALISDT